MLSTARDFHQQAMNIDSTKEFVGGFMSHHVPTVAAVVIGILMLVLIVKTAKFMMKILFLIVGVGLLAGACWWHSLQ